MKMKYVGDAVCVLRKYKDKDGNEKTVYQKCGALFRGEDGRYSIKIEVTPIENWNGWLSVYPPKKRDSDGDGIAEESSAEPINLSDIPF